MNNHLTLAQPQAEIDQIVTFGRQVFNDNHFQLAVIGISGGIDSALALTILSKILPPENIFCLQMPDGDQPLAIQLGQQIIDFNQIPSTNCQLINLAAEADLILNNSALETEQSLLRRGNICARLRMIHLFDSAAVKQALVVGTENKSEEELGYFTLHGDQAASVELFAHLYKTQIYQLANFLELPAEIISQPPSANLWPGQTDEAELGYSYHLIDQVLWAADNQPALLTELNPELVKTILDRRKSQSFKQLLPYRLVTTETSFQK